MENENALEDESGGTTPQPLKTLTQATEAKDGKTPTPTVGWRESYEAWVRKMYCPNCGHSKRMDLVPGLREVDDRPMLYYTCKKCGCQFTRQARFQDIIDKQERI